MTDKHTPGPWRAEGWENTVVNSRDGFTITLCPAGSHNAGLPEIKANATLIAAAPDMLDALQMILDHDGRLTGADMAAIHDAIAKATGTAYTPSKVDHGEIVIVIDGGNVQSVDGVPHGVTVTVKDYDNGAAADPMDVEIEHDDSGSFVRQTYTGD